MTVFKLPDLGEGLSEAEVLKWHVSVGDRVRVDDPLLAVETAKAIVEVPSPLSGTIFALHARPGDRIEIGAPLVEFAPDGATESSPSREPAAATVVGQMPATADDYPASQTAFGAAARTHAAARQHAVPAARALARQLGVDLSGCTGSGADGLITLPDVLARAGLIRDSPDAAGRRPIPSPPLEAPPGRSAQVEPVRGLRRAMAQSMAASRNEIAACTVFDDAGLSHWSADADFSVRVLRALGFAARSERSLNAWYDAAHERRLLFSSVDVGVAVDTPEGLIVPVIRGVDSMDAPRMRAELDRLKRGAKDRTLEAGELRHCTIMLSNFGSLAGRYATPVVVPPAVAILAVGRARPDERRLPLSLSFDHRVVTGAEAVRFLGALITDLELAQ
jgi:pyruvate dehydrogenase E2 component (dihydrolipoamide acetyltransferase)